jgi:hypothetical protein
MLSILVVMLVRLNTYLKVTRSGHSLLQCHIVLWDSLVVTRALRHRPKCHSYWRPLLLVVHAVNKQAHAQYAFPLEPTRINTLTFLDATASIPRARRMRDCLAISKGESTTAIKMPITIQDTVGSSVLGSQVPPRHQATDLHSCPLGDCNC